MKYQTSFSFVKANTNKMHISKPKNLTLAGVLWLYYVMNGSLYGKDKKYFKKIYRI